ncbi:MAG: segregation/condensation protein A [Gammaproteobacteria bacterium]|nr:segregation/condensation protein A [Gammaproteobacteria bacterium]|tara:strand:- start:5295 stop:6107 length:813 start_codon:yes stop_codon:yes gene_type:complete
MDTDPQDHIDSPESIKIPLAYVKGKPLEEIPRDLYLPPDALKIILESFEGPLDLLLYLIRKQNFDILELPVAKITEQYMQYIGLMEDLKLELAAEYLLMAATLAEIKSKMLLPVHSDLEEEEDPRQELIRRLREYEIFKEASINLDSIPRSSRDFYNINSVKYIRTKKEEVPETVDLVQLATILNDIIIRNKILSAHEIKRDILSVREKMAFILDTVSSEDYTEFTSILKYEEGKHGLIVTFLAILELIKVGLIDCLQAEPFSKIYIKLM